MSTLDNVKALYEKVKKIVKKDNFTKIKLAILVVFSGLLATILEYTLFRRYYPEFISNNRIMLVTLILLYIGMHFIFKISKMYEFIHKNRYKIACAFLLFVTIFKYSGSSIVNFNSLVQSHNDDRRYHTLLGTARMNRTDEWATSTTYILSQTKGENVFKYFNNRLRGTDTDMFTVANSPVADILILGRPFQIGFLLFGTDSGLSFYWYARLVAMLLGSYELCLILTKKNKKVSFIGMIMITFSAATQWWYCLQPLIWGQIVVILIDKFMNVDKKRYKYLCAFGIFISGMAYIFELYPAWQVSFGYVFLALVIWILIKNIKYGNYKFTKHDILVIIITLLCIALMVGRWYLKSKDTIYAEMNTDYPGDRQEVGGGAYNLYSYFYDIYFTFQDFLNPCEFSSMLSFYPIPLLLGLIYVIRNRKDLHFWIPVLIVGAFLTVWCTIGFPTIIANLTKMSMTTSSRVSIPLGTLCIYILIYLFANFDINEEDKLINKKLSYILAFLLTAFIAYKAKKTIGYEPDFLYLNKSRIIKSGLLFLIAIWGILNLNNRKIRNGTLYCLIGIALLSGLRVNPVIRTADIFYTKPVAIKMQEIRNENPDAIWAVVDGGWYINDYAVANGIRTINSTNVYPNLEMYETILGEKAEEQRKDYNRYAHVNFDITDEESKVELLFADNVSIKLNYKDLEKLNIEYILTKKDLSKESFSEYFKELYYEDEMYIYKVTKGN